MNSTSTYIAVGKMSELRIQDRSRRAWMVCFGSFVCNMIIGGVMSCSGVFFSVFLEAYKETRGETAWVAVLSSSAVYFFAPLSTSLCNRIGCRMTVAMGTIICMVAMTSSSLHSSFEALYFTHGIFWGLGASLCYYPNFIILAQYFQKRISFANGISVSGSSIGMMAMSPFIRYVFSRFGLSNGFRVLAAIHTLLFISVCSYRPLQTDKTAKTESRTSRKCCDENVLKNTKYWIWVVTMFLFQLNYMIPFVHLVRLGEDVGASKITASLLTSVMAGSSLIARVTFGRVADLKCLSRINILQIALLCIAVSTTLVPFAPSFIWVALYASVFGFNEGIYIMIFMVITKDIVGGEHMALALGTLYGVLFLPKTIGPLFAGFMFDRYQSYVLPFMVMGGVTALAAVLLFLIPIKTSRETNCVDIDDEPETEIIICRETSL